MLSSALAAVACRTRPSGYDEDGMFELAPLDRRDDFSRHNRVDRWWGGTRLTNAKLWLGDPLDAMLIRPANDRTGLANDSRYFIRIGVARSTGTTVTLFFGDPSTSRSE
jgi:hypothetical protein